MLVSKTSAAAFFFYMTSTLPGTNIITTTAQQINGNDPCSGRGANCDVMVESCSQYEGAGDHQCYHGGRCIEGLIDHFGNEQLFCDCSSAYDAEEDMYYVGRYCEHRSINYCDNPNIQFCSNGGECNDNYGSTTDNGPPCICNEDFTGPHCEFKSGNLPVCDLSCQNGGHCVFGEPTGGDHNYQYWATENKEDFMHCSCPDGFDGPTCEVETSVCGEGYCFHGSECIPTLNDDVGHVCNCNAANERSNVSYAGRFCQYQATAYCTESFFCVNGGSCKTGYRNQIFEGCDCLPGFEGFSCEFRVAINSTGDGDGAPVKDVEPVKDSIISNSLNTSNQLVLDDPDYIRCDLDCMNGGVCRKGAKSYGNGLGDVIRDVDHLNKLHTEDFEHCVCPTGFIGLQCKHEIQVCGANQHHCLHGSSCVSNNGFHSCDCSTTNGEDTFAGDSCQHKVSSICEETNNGANPSAYCVNGASCVREVSSGESHPGCICSPGYYGPHCERSRSNNEMAATTTSGRTTNNIMERPSHFVDWIVGLAIVALIIVGGILLLRVARLRTRRKQLLSTRDAIISSRGSFVDGPSSFSSNFARDVYKDEIPSSGVMESSDSTSQAVDHASSNRGNVGSVMMTMESNNNAEAASSGGSNNNSTTSADRELV